MSVFVPSLDGTFVYDDTVLIQDNVQVHALKNFFQWFQGDLFEAPLDAVRGFQRQHYYRPLVLGSYALDWSIGDGEPWVFHATNLLLHGWVAWLAARVLSQWMGGFWAPVVAALVFALHPTKAESVAWISGRTDLAAGALLLTALLAHVRARDRRSGAHLVLSMGLLLGALLCKETAVVFPVLALLAPLSEGRVRPFRDAVVWTLPATAVVLLYLILRAVWLPLGTGSSFVEGWSRVPLVLEALGRFVELFFLPTDVTFFASRLRLSEGRVVFDGLRVALGALALIAVAVFSFWSLKRRRVQTGLRLLVAALACALPSLQLVPTGLTVIFSARFLHLPSLFLAGFTVWALREAASRLRPRLQVGLLTPVAVLVLLGLGAGALLRTRDFLDSGRLWRAELSSNSTVPEVVLGVLPSDGARGGNQLTIRRAVCAFRASEESYASHGTSRFVRIALHASLKMLPDGSAALAEAANFVALVRTGREARSAGALDLHLPAGSSVQQEVARRGAQWMLDEAEWRARSGQAKAARRLLDGALVGCLDCVDLLRRGMKVAVQIGDSRLARQLAERVGPDAVSQLAQVEVLMRRARELPGPQGAFFWARAGEVLGDVSWGWRALSPFRKSLASAPADVRLSAMLIASKAGDADWVAWAWERSTAAERDRLEELGLPQPLGDRHAALVPGTCALPSELSGSGW